VDSGANTVHDHNRPMLLSFAPLHAPFLASFAICLSFVIIKIDLPGSFVLCTSSISFSSSSRRTASYNCLRLFAFAISLSVFFLSAAALLAARLFLAAAPASLTEDILRLTLIMARAGVDDNCFLTEGGMLLSFNVVLGGWVEAGCVAGVLVGCDMLTSVVCGSLGVRVSVHWRD
jgi:hypothetical protein